MTLGRPILPLQLSSQERETLERWVRCGVRLRPRTCPCGRGSS